MAAGLQLLEQPSGVVVATPRLEVIEGGRSSTTNKHARRLNPDSLWDGPEGTFPCPVPTCNLPIRFEDASDESAICPGGHEHSPLEEANRFYEQSFSGGYTHCGLTSKRQGDIAEHLVLEVLVDLQEYGQVVQEARPYHCPLDGVTNLGWGVEVKSVNAAAKNIAYAPNASQKRSKNNYIQEHNLKGVVNTLVPLDFKQGTADVYIYGSDRVKYYERGTKGCRLLAASVPFDNPFREEGCSAELPF
jgi:hypothetical protein